MTSKSLEKSSMGSGETRDMEEQICKDCQISKPLIDFGSYEVRGKVCFRKSCKRCRVSKFQDKYRNDPELVSKMKENAKKSRLKNLYGLKEVDVDCLMAAQQGKCRICLRTPERSLNIDHNHQTGAVRGLLCWQCNIALGYFKEDTDSLGRAIRYLKETPFDFFVCWLKGVFEKNLAGCFTTIQVEEIKHKLSVAMSYEAHKGQTQ